MAVKVFEFSEYELVAADNKPTINHPKNNILQMASGEPLAASIAPGAVTFNANTKFIKVVGDGDITWPGGLTETFTGTEFRGVGDLTGLTILA